MGFHGDLIPYSPNRNYGKRHDCAEFTIGGKEPFQSFSLLATKLLKNKPYSGRFHLDTEHESMIHIMFNGDPKEITQELEEIMGIFGSPTLIEHGIR